MLTESGGTPLRSGDGWEARFARTFARAVPPAVAASFSAEQMAALRAAFAAQRWRRHPVDVRLSGTCLAKPFYFVLLAGIDRRGRAERHGRPVVTLGNAAIAVALALLLGCAGLILAYLLKSALGINLSSELSLGLWTALREQVDLLLR